MNTKPPSPVAVRNRWTAREEGQLQELIERRKRIMAENREPVMLIVGTLPRGEDWGDGWCGQLTDWLIANADALRAALEPFDSGVRPATPRAA